MLPRDGTKQEISHTSPPVTAGVIDQASAASPERLTSLVEVQARSAILAQTESQAVIQR